MRQRKKLFLQIGLGYLLCCLLAGCISPGKYVGKKQYLFDLPQGSIPKMSAKCKGLITFGSTEAIAPFDRLNFLYRIAPSRYLIDYYHGFLVPPTEQIDAILAVNLGDFDNFGSNTKKAKKQVQIKIIELTADYQNRNNPKAVITLQFVLTNASKTKVLFDKLFKESISLQAKDTNSLIKAWNRGLRQALSRGLDSLKHKLNC